MIRLALVWLALLVAACGGPQPAPSVAVGTTADAQTVILANLYAAALRYYGRPAHVETVPDPWAALDSGTLTVAPAFTGRVLQRFSPGSAARTDAQVYRAMIGALPEGLAAGDYATAAEDKPALAVTGATARAWGGRDLAALVKHCAGLTVGAVAGARDLPTAVGDCTLPPVKEFPDLAAMFAAIRTGAITAGWTGTADPGVPADLVVLADRKPQLVRAENVVPIYRRNSLDDIALRAVNEVAGVLDTEALVDMRRRVAAGADPRSVAEEWLAAHPLGR